MKRVIKFRGWSKELNRWVYGGYCHTEKCDFIIEGDISSLNSSVWSVIPESVGMFTGVIGMDGVEIYEGDTLVTNNGSISEVVFGEYEYEYENYEGVTEDVSGIGFSFSGGEPFGEGARPYKVIGNKFESKED